MTSDMNIDSFPDFNSKLSLYIPSINHNITYEDIKSIFIVKKIGVISRIDFVFNNKGIRQAFVHFSLWFLNDYTKDLQIQIMDPKLTAIVELDKQKKNNFGNSNIILLPNHNPRDLPNTDLINTLQERINQLESKFNELNSRESFTDNSKRTRYVN